MQGGDDDALALRRLSDDEAALRVLALRTPRFGANRSPGDRHTSCCHCASAVCSGDAMATTGTKGSVRRRTMIKHKVGAVRTTSYDLPPDSFVYGRPEIHDDVGCAEGKQQRQRMHHSNQEASAIKAQARGRKIRHPTSYHYQAMQASAAEGKR